jgi:Raf kinase inhibitor-like YbhB/YbcL family protein
MIMTKQKIWTAIVGGVGVAAGVYWSAGALLGPTMPRANVSNNPFAMTLESIAFGNNDLIPSTYTCDGENVNPPLTISRVPEGAKSLVLIMDDPDSPRGTWVHWLVYNLEPFTTQIPENIGLIGGKGMNSWKKSGYGGPCPQTGEHRYVFKLYALDTSSTVSDVTPTKADIESMMHGHILAEAQLVGRYKRQ